MNCDIFMKACELAFNHYEWITIGGGEPTLHPKIIEYIGIAYMHCNDDGVPLIISNGTNKKLSMRLLQMARSKKIDFHISDDGYHDYSIVDGEVMAYARKYKLLHSNHSDNLSAVGRALEELGKDYCSNYCVCDDWLIVPNGDIYTCGCKKKIIGNVNDILELPERDYCEGPLADLDKGEGDE